jgi:hypothetical protein
MRLLWLHVSSNVHMKPLQSGVGMLLDIANGGALLPAGEATPDCRLDAGKV